MHERTSICLYRLSLLLTFINAMKQTQIVSRLSQSNDGSCLQTKKKGILL